MRNPILASVGLVGLTVGLVAAAPQGTKAPPAKTVAKTKSVKPPANGINPDVFLAQVQLDRLGFSPGVIDGRAGISLTAALKGFQEAKGLSVTGKLDDPTKAGLKEAGAVEPLVTIPLTEEMLAGPFIDPMPEDAAEKAKLQSLGYRSPMEKLAERFHTTPQILLALNSGDTRLSPGSPVKFPNVVPASTGYDAKLPAAWRTTLAGLNVDASQPQGAKIVVDKSDGVLRVLDASGKLVAQFQATMGSSKDPLPIGTWKVQGAEYNPKFNYNPALFWDAKPGDKKQLLPAGPNGPVGVIWLDLNKPHYGIHGTPEPSTIGRAQSHGCIRLTNWDAARLSLMVKAGTPAVFQP